VGVLADNRVSPSHSIFLVPQGACVAGCMLRVAYMTQTSSLRHVHVLNSVHRCFMLDTKYWSTVQCNTSTVRVCWSTYVRFCNINGTLINVTHDLFAMTDPAVPAAKRPKYTAFSLAEKIWLLDYSRKHIFYIIFLRNLHLALRSTLHNSVLKPSSGQDRITVKSIIGSSP
jgi:hypothetical protein